MNAGLWSWWKDGKRISVTTGFFVRRNHRAFNLKKWTNLFANTIVYVSWYELNGYGCVHTELACVKKYSLSSVNKV